jgi:MFS family permease
MLEVGSSFSYRRQVFLVLWIVNFVLNFAVSLISAPVPYLTREFVVGSDIQAATIEAYGLMLSLGYVAVTLGYFVGGFAADSVGRRTVVITSFVILAIGCGLFAVATSLFFLFLAIFMQQFGFGVAAPAISALVADYSKQSSRGMAYGVFNLSWITAQIPAPLLGGAMAQFVNLRVPFVMAVLISIMGMLFSVLMKGKNAEKCAAENESGSMRGPDSNDVGSYGKAVLVFSLANLLNGVLNGFIGPLFNGLLMFKLNANPTEYGLVFSVGYGVVTTLVQIPGGKLTDRFGRKPLTLFSFFSVPLIVALAFSQSILQFSLIIGGICAIGNISSPAISAWLMDLVPENRRASVSGITRTLNGIGLSVGPTAGSYVWNSSKPDTVVPFGLAALIFASGLPFYLVLKETNRGSAPLADSS